MPERPLIGVLLIAAIVAVNAGSIALVVAILRGGRLRRARVYRVAPGLIVIEERRTTP